jgi:hypothetical protein
MSVTVPVPAAAAAVSQGVFGLVNNLGSLVVRLIFAPFEDAAFTAFSRWGGAWLGCRWVFRGWVRGWLGGCLGGLVGGWLGAGYALVWLLGQ